MKKTDEEEELQKMIEIKKYNYRETMSEVKKIKNEIGRWVIFLILLRVEKTLERARERMQKDFEKWLLVMMKDRGMVPDESGKYSNYRKSEQSSTKDNTLIPKVRL